jgi:ATP-dependent Zn protease
MKMDKINLDLNIMGLSGITKSKAEKFMKDSNINIKFNDVAGISNSKKKYKNL